MEPPEDLGNLLAKYENAANVTAAKIAIHTAVAAIPYAGGPILELWSGVAQRRVQERLHKVFIAMKDCTERLSEEKIDRAFFESEEFQALLFLLIEKLHTTHDSEKLKVFGSALANSGRVDFKEDDKEQYVRVLRDLSLSDLRILNDGRLKGWLPHVRQIEYGSEVMVSLSRLRGMGLVLDKLNMGRYPRATTANSLGDMEAAVSQLFTQPPKKTFHLSDFGEKFLRFISDTAAPNQTETP